MPKKVTEAGPVEVAQRLQRVAELMEEEGFTISAVDYDGRLLLEDSKTNTKWWLRQQDEDEPVHEFPPALDYHLVQKKESAPADSKVLLVPPHLSQCQAEKPGNGPFTIGGKIGNPKRGYRVRCEAKPTVIATAKRPGKDGQHGSMSLCDECKEAMIKQCGEDFATFVPISERASSAK